MLTSGDERIRFYLARILAARLGARKPPVSNVVDMRLVAVDVGELLGLVGTILNVAPIPGDVDSVLKRRVSV